MALSPGLLKVLGVVFLSILEPLLDEVYVVLRCSNALRGLLLEGMQDINRILELDRINSSIGVAIVIADDFQDTGPGKPFQRLGSWGLIPDLGKVEAVTHFILHRLRELPDVVLAVAKPY
jgi:hypothetical protein